MFDVAIANAAEPTESWFMDGDPGCPDRFANSYSPRRDKSVAIEAIIDDARRENAFGLLMSLNMLIEFGDAFDYTAADFRKWCGEVGFKRFETIHLNGAHSAVVAYK